MARSLLFEVKLTERRDRSGIETVLGKSFRTYEPVQASEPVQVVK